MQKAIHIDSSGKLIERVLSIADPGIIDANPTGLSYTIIDDYRDPPTLVDAQLDKAYPMYNKQEKKFFWQVVNYQVTAGEDVLKFINMEEKMSRLEQENTSLKEVVDALLFDALVKGGA